MNNALKNIIVLLILVLSGLFIWYFFRIVLYVIISVVLSLLGQPVADFLHRMRIGSIRLPLGASAFLTLMLMIGVFMGFVAFFFPLLASQAAFVSELDIATLSRSLEYPLSQVEFQLKEWTLLDAEETLSGKIISELIAIATFDRFSLIFNSVINFIVEIFFGFLAISFITFFFLKEKHLFSNIIVFFTPTPHKEEAREIFAESKVLLRRYFVGLLTDLASVFLMISLAMWIIGLPNALVIGFFAGLLNIIPYVGPIIATFIGVFLGLSVNLHMDFMSQMVPLIIGIIASFIIVNTIDVGVLQPMIYSKSVRTHPLEIFIVFIIAGMIAGVFGMIVAIPTYSVIRIIVKQFITKSKMVKSLQDSFNTPATD
ncbi:MAG: AI-2E family transporter [Bacteroidetes bacterium]|nr:MAG: AI-2E family transporter [Bacteroidota bacterium]